MPVNLNSNQYESIVSSLFMSGNDVYAAVQTYANGLEKACYWKNGILVSLHDETLNNYSETTDLYVKDNVVYAAGIETDLTTFVSAPVYWANGIKKYLPLPANSIGYANSIFVSDNVVYVAGFTSDSVSGIRKAILWKNGERIELPHSPSYGNATSIFIK